MKYINVETQHGLIRIQLVQNTFTEKYVAQLQKMYSIFDTIIQSGPPLGLFRGMNPAFIQSQTDKFISIIDEFNSLGLDFPYTVTKDSFTAQDEAGQDLLNKLHRSFTTANKCHFDGLPTLFWSDRFSSNFVVPEGKMDRVMYLTEIINSMVHDTEFYMNTPRKPVNRQDVVNQVEILASVTNDNPHSDLGPYSTLKGWFYCYTDEDYELFSDSDEYDVWVGRDILGKDFIHAFYDCDDPTNWDVTGSLGGAGKIGIDVGPVTKSAIIKSDSFRAWLDEYRVTYSKKMGGMPLGTVVVGREILTKFSMPEIISVSFE